MQKIRSKVVGVSHQNDDGSHRQRYIQRFCRAGMPIGLRREPKNKYSVYAVSVWVKGQALLVFSADVQIGYLSDEVARKIAPQMDAGVRVYGKISGLTGGTHDKPTRGVNIELEVYSK